MGKSMILRFIDKRDNVMVTAYGFVLQGIGTLMSIVFREILMGEDMHEYLADVL